MRFSTSAPAGPASTPASTAAAHAKILFIESPLPESGDLAILSPPRRLRDRVGRGRPEHLDDRLGDALEVDPRNGEARLVIGQHAEALEALVLHEPEQTVRVDAARFVKAE